MSLLYLIYNLYIYTEWINAYVVHDVMYVILAICFHIIFKYILLKCDDILQLKSFIQEKKRSCEVRMRPFVLKRTRMVDL